MLTDLYKPKRIKLTEKKVGRPLMHIKLPTIAYLPNRGNTSFPNETRIHNYQEYKNSQEFKILLNCYLSKNPHLQFVTFHKYGDNPPQLIFINMRNNKKICILLSEFREYDEIKVGGYSSIAKSLDDVLEKR
jgi:hypothetical protein